MAVSEAKFALWRERGTAAVLTRLIWARRANPHALSPQMSARSVCLLLFFASRFVTANPGAENVRGDTHNPIISHIPRERVSSSAIASVGYSKRQHILEVEFANGRVYRYLQVTPSVYREFMSADSKARYYDRNIKGNYPSMPVRPRLKDQSD